jgi:tetratricopeptide (TPR) repeat protein
MVALSLDQLGGVYLNQRKYAEAEPYFRRALAIREKLTGADRAALARSLENLGSLYAQQSRYGEAVEFESRAVRVFEETLGPQSPQLADGLQNLGRALTQMDRHDDARRTYERAIQIAEKGKPQQSLSPLLEEYAGVLRKSGNVKEAEAVSERAKSMRAKGAS